ncbi:MAG: hypothetical protein SPC78_05510 [Candidatus Faecousia sp.]|nr:hypothetical protein [Clostridiales bacterium]MDY4599071.1 hypothetical protein [Candidatus Faecousia sp.]
MYFPVFELHGWGKRFADQPQTMFRDSLEADSFRKTNTAGASHPEYAAEGPGRQECRALFAVFRENMRVSIATWGKKRYNHLRKCWT